MDKKKIILVIAVLIIVLFGLCLAIIYNLSKEELQKIDNEIYGDTLEASSIHAYDLKEEPEEIVIYDIEEGYLTVPYNALAKKNEYNWDEYLKSDGEYYKYEDNTYKTKLGIDVSSYQGNINWEEVKKSGIEFAILRLGYRGYGEAGNIVLDASFEDNYKNAKAEGIEIGVYFFSQAINMEEVRAEAEFVLEQLNGKELSYPIAFDLEKIKNDTARTDNLTLDEITNMTLEFCKIIESQGYTPSIYGNAKTFTTKMQLELFNDYNKWYADYQEKPLYPYEFEIWQYTESGRVNGIEGNVDIDIHFVKK